MSSLRVVNVYSARHYDTDQQLYQQFTDQSGAKVNLIEGDADQLIERIKAEGANSPADVLITVAAGRLHRAVEAELLSPVDSQVLEERIPDHLQHPDNVWFGVSQRVRGIVYAKDRVDPAQIESSEDLAGPIGKIGSASARRATSITSRWSPR